jgi:hypothetical protein
MGRLWPSMTSLFHDRRRRVVVAKLLRLPADKAGQVPEGRRAGRGRPTTTWRSQSRMAKRTTSCASHADWRWMRWRVSTQRERVRAAPQWNGVPIISVSADGLIAIGGIDHIGIILDGTCAKFRKPTSRRAYFSAQRLIDLTPGGVRQRPANLGDAADDIVRAPAVEPSPPDAKSDLYRRKQAMPARPGRLGTC